MGTENWAELIDKEGVALTPICPCAASGILGTHPPQIFGRVGKCFASGKGISRIEGAFFVLETAIFQVTHQPIGLCPANSIPCERRRGIGGGCGPELGLGACDGIQRPGAHDFPRRSAHAAIHAAASDPYSTHGIHEGSAQTPVARKAGRGR